MKRRPVSRLLAVHLAASQADEAHTPAWMLTFGDLMTLLLVFFVMLASVGEYRSDDQLQNLWQAIHRQFRRETDDLATDTMIQLRGPQRRFQTLVRQNDDRRRRLLSAPAVPPVPTANLDSDARPEFSLQFDGPSRLDDSQAARLRNWGANPSEPASIVEVRGYVSAVEHASTAEDSEDAGDMDNARLAYRNLMLVRQFLVRELGFDAARVRCTLSLDPGAERGLDRADAAARVDLYLRHASYSELGTTHHVRTQSRR